MPDLIVPDFKTSTQSRFVLQPAVSDTLGTRVGHYWFDEEKVTMDAFISSEDINSAKSGALDVGEKVLKLVTHGTPIYRGEFSPGDSFANFSACEGKTPQERIFINNILGKVPYGRARLACRQILDVLKRTGTKI